ncbi:MAG: hypothetical protein AAFY08_04965 [Planctomycetota bacterium]
MTASHTGGLGVLAPGGVIDSELHCVVCGASLRGRALTGTCGRCGARVSETIDRLDPTYKLDTDGRLGESIGCRDCGYDLRGMRPSDNCPECGLAVRESMRSDVLGLMKPAWLKRVRSGLTMMFVSLALAIVGGVLLGVVGTAIATATAVSGGGGGSMRVMMGMSVAMLAFQVLVCGTIWLVGVYLFTAAEPTGRREAEAGPTKMARYAEVIGYGASLIVGAIASVQMMGSGVGLVGPQLLFSMCSTVAGVVSFAGLMFLGSRLFARVPTGRLTQQARRVAWGVLIFGGISVVGEAGQSIVQLSAGSAPVMAQLSQAAQAQSGTAVPGGQSQTTVHTNADGSVVETTVTTFPDGSTMTEAETRNANGTVTQTSQYVSSTNVSFAGGNNVPLLVVQLIGGLGLAVVGIWGLVLAILLYRKLNAAIVNATDRLKLIGSGEVFEVQHRVGGV